MLRTTLFALILWLPSILCSQVLVGASGGINRTAMSGDAPSGATYTSQFGFSASAVIDFPLGDDIRLSLQPGYARVGTGIAVTSVFRESYDSLAISLSYVSIPLLARVISNNGVTFATGGLQGGFLLNASADPASGGPSTELTNALASFDLAIVIGLGAQLPLSTSTATIELRYMQSLLNLGSTDAAATAFGVPPRFRLSGLQFVAGILFSL